jgi:hypothetical protein
MVLFASGYKVRAVAEVLGCDAKTLRKVFPREVANAARAELVVRSGMMAKLAELLEGGNVGAAKQLDKMIVTERIKLGVAGVPPGHRAFGAEPKLPAPGKKESALRKAKEAEGRFATRQAPSLLMQ